MADVPHRSQTGLNAAHPPAYPSESDPTTTLGPHRWWVKPSTGVVKRRNAANTAWDDVVTAGGGGGSVSAATEGSAGIAELATQTETNTGTDDARIVTPLKAATRYLAKVGGTLTGFLTLHADPTSPMHATTKQYADALVAGGASPASETTAGIAELATTTETNTGTDDARIVTPLKLASRTSTETRAGVVELATDAEAQTGTDTARAITPANLSARSATETRSGIAEVATQAETNTGTDDAKMVTPLKLKTNVDLHINDTTDAHDASAISFAPAGSVASTNVQAAIEEVASEAGGGGSAHTIKDEGSAMTQRANLNFVGAGVTVTDDAGNSETEVTISGGGSGYTPDYVAQSGGGDVYTAWGNGDPTTPWFWLNTNTATSTLVSPNSLTAAARLVKFRLPVGLSVSSLKAFTFASTTGFYTVAIYPVGSGTSKLYDSGFFNTSLNAWVSITANTPFSLSANTDYWLAIAANTGSTGGGFRMLSWSDANYFGADAAPLGPLSLGIPVFASISVTNGAWPSTLPAIASQASTAPPLIYLEGTAS